MKIKRQKSEIVMRGIVDYLSESGERALLPEVARSLEAELAKNRKSDQIIVTTAIPLSKPQSEFIRKFIQNTLRTDLKVTNKVNKGILGGLTIKVNDWFLDASLKHQVELVKKTLLS
ncbi:MAG: F0F1 ATP synthase subunit delta [Patescibacteria group bacterium]|nr:F0F1 ATP synthase subunit delta [Patescibacteria group bacterium]